MKNHPTITPHLLYDLIGLKQIDAAFLDFLNGEDPALHDALIKARQNPSCHTDAQESALLTSLTPLLEVFLGDLFGIQAPLETLQKAINEKSIIFQIRRTFIQRRALKNITQENAKNLNGQELAEKLTPHVGAPSFSDLDFARWVQKALADPALVEPLEWAEEYAAWRVWHLEGQLQNPYSSLFHVPRSTDYLNLFPFLKDDSGGIKSHVVDQKPRDGFETPGLEKTFSQALGEAHYCILCHPQNKDSCAKGLLEKGSPTPQKNPLGVALSGCPLKQKISEMNGLFRDGFVIGALGIICIDNPMVAATGYRICNDCRLSCIYQKQDSVDVPSVESQILRTVLELPFGFEIYSLLTRWNPLNIRAPLPQEPSGYHILVAGMGPAGFTLSHYLMNAGHRVLGIDGLKIDPLPASLVGMGESYDFELIRDTRALWSSLETREIGGFGGVSEYGITVRWDKNFLTLIRLLLERRRTQFALLGNTRLGGTLTLPQISDLGFDHVALCLGAGSPHTLPLSGGLSKGVRQASDFLMSLHLGAAFQQDSLTNWTLRMPVVVLGGGLTAVDTATEAQSYYIRQAEKFADQYETLVRENGRAHTESDWRTEDREIAQEFLEHAKAIRMERKRAHAAGQSPNFIPLVHQWGGVRILYRRTLQESPAYRLNADEIYAALQEGIIFEENWAPDSMSTDKHRWVESIACANTKNQAHRNYPARTILVAFGTNPNLTIFEEKEISIPIEGNRFKKTIASKVLLDSDPETRISLSHFGDLNQNFAGSVVRALASAKDGYPEIDQCLRLVSPRTRQDALKLAQEKLETTLVEINNLTPTILELVIKAPLATHRFQPGQFFRFQNRTPPFIEPLALTGASADPKTGLLSLILLKMGASSDLCQKLKPGDTIALMGPTGCPTPIPENKNVLLIGGGLGNAVLFSIGAACRAKGCRVLYVAGYKSPHDIFKKEQIEASADQILWCVEDADTDAIPDQRPQDLFFRGRVTDGLLAHATRLSLANINQGMIIGSAPMMAAVQALFAHKLRPYFSPDARFLASLNSPMQCMMKGICAQCLQRVSNPETGEEQVIFACKNQDQPLDWIDFKCLSDRLEQNTIAEKISRRYFH